MRAGQDNGAGRGQSGDGAGGRPAAAGRAVEGAVVAPGQIRHCARYSCRALVGDTENRLAGNAAAAYPRSWRGEIAAVTQHEVGADVRAEIQGGAASPGRIGKAW